MTVYFITVMSRARFVTMEAARLLANADVVIGDSETFDVLASMCGHNAEQISFAAGVAREVYIDELRAVLERHAHDPDAVIIRLILDRGGDHELDGKEILAVHDAGADYEVIFGTKLHNDDRQVDGVRLEGIGLPRRGALVGISVVVPRARHQAAPLSDLLLLAGATPITVPVIDIVDPEDKGEQLREAIDRLDDYAWVIFTSQNAVARAVDALERHGGADNAAASRRTKIAAVGGATKAALERCGYSVDRVPVRASAKALVELFSYTDDSSRVLFPCADIAGEALDDGLRLRGYLVDRVTAYHTVYPTISPFVRHRSHGADAIVFTSPSTVTGFLAAVGREQCPATVITIGPTTTNRAKELGIWVTRESTEQSLDGAVEALIICQEGPR